MKIGIPKALGYYYYSPFWKRFLSELDCTVIESESSTRKILQDGCAISPSEACLPLKSFMGHVINLIDKVDALFIPRMVCLQKKPQVRLGCPKYIALPDMVKAFLPAVKTVSPNLDYRKCSQQDSFVQSAQEMGFSRKNGLKAYKAALEQSSSQMNLTQFPSIENEEQLTIAVLGHAYLVHDSFLSLNILNRLKSLGCRVLDFSAHGSSGSLKTQRKPVSWYFEEDILLSAEKLLASSHIDGIVYLLSFGCGAGSITSEIMRLELSSPDTVPVMRVIVDEHTGEAGFNTRLESYVDMLRMGKEVK
ncbi:Activator of (R)-2-hydroxyglutaryl-CoA dehydratase [Chitinispirillum alkaliphilum]|nr:Activator of (R)-2-hydroxyglutaryl-CoA dehydratase [Chitinispirillum alkaliphilum]